MDFIAIMLGWPSLGSALLCAVIGGWLRRPAWLWIAVVLASPMAFYLAGASRWSLVSLIPLAALVVAALTCRRGPRWACASGVGTFAAGVAGLAFVVLFQDTA